MKWRRRTNGHDDAGIRGAAVREGRLEPE